MDFKAKLTAMITGALDLKAIGEQNLSVARKYSSEKTALHYYRVLRDVVLEGVTFPSIPSAQQFIEKHKVTPTTPGSGNGYQKPEFLQV